MHRMVVFNSLVVSTLVAISHLVLTEPSIAIANRTLVGGTPNCYRLASADPGCPNNPGNALGCGGTDCNQTELTCPIAQQTKYVNFGNGYNAVTTGFGLGKRGSVLQITDCGYYITCTSECSFVFDGIANVWKYRCTNDENTRNEVYYTGSVPDTTGDACVVDNSGGGGNP